MKFNDKYVDYISIFESSILKDVDIDEIIKMIRLPQDVDENEYKLVVVNVDKFDKLWKKTDPTYVSSGGKGGDPEKYQKAIRFFQQDLIDIQKNFLGVESSVAYVSDDYITINDGRHRFVVLRDAGVKKLPIAMQDESIEKAKELGLI